LDKTTARQQANFADPLTRVMLALEGSPECLALQRYQVAFHLQFNHTLRRLDALRRQRVAKISYAPRTQEHAESKPGAQKPRVAKISYAPRTQEHAESKPGAREPEAHRSGYPGRQFDGSSYLRELFLSSFDPTRTQAGALLLSRSDLSEGVDELHKGAD
jgi:hypothetical protein